MKITALLMKPYLEQLDREFSSLVVEISKRPSVEVTNLKKNVEKKQDELHFLQQRLPGAVGEDQVVVPHEVYDAFRRLKLDLRFARRHWLKIISNTERLRKMYARRTHVSTFAA